jgi:type II secretory pathway component PulK
MVLAFMTAVLGSMSLGLLVEARYARANQERLEAFYLARAGLEAAYHALGNDDPGFDGLADPWCGEVLLEKGLGDGSCDVTYIDEQTGQRRPGIVDEERKLNINLADRAMLMALSPDFTDSVAKAVIAHRLEHPFASPEDLATVPGLSMETLLRPRPQLDSGVLGLLTVVGDGKVNVNTAPVPVLKCLPVLTDAQVQSIVTQRNGPDGKPGTADDKPFKSLAELAAALNLSDAALAQLKPWVSVASKYFTIRAMGRIPGKRLVLCELRQTVLREDNALTTRSYERVR